MAGRREIQRQLSSKLHNHPHILLDDSNQFFKYCPADQYSTDDDILTMIKVLLYLHDNNISLKKLDWYNNIVRDHERKLMFRGLDFINSSPESRKNDFTLLARLIENSWRLSTFEEELVTKDLIQRMHDYSCGDSDRDLLLNHVAFKSFPEKLSFITKAFAQRTFLSGDDQKKYEQVLKQMDVNFAASEKDWRQEIRQSHEKCVKKCLEYKPKSRRVNYQNTTSSKLQFCRNLATHLPQYLLQDGVPKDKILSETCRIIFTLFGKELLTFQELAHKKGILEHFMPGYTLSTPTTQTQSQDYNISDNVGGGEQGTHQYCTQGRSRAVAKPNGYIKGG